MNKILKDFNNNRYTFIALGGFIFLLVVGYFLFSLMVPNSGAPVYGNRLKCTDSLEITSIDMEAIKKKLTDTNKNVIRVTPNISGNTLNVIIELKKATKIEDAKKLAPVISAALKKAQASCYDIEVYIINENKAEKGYPAIGSKKHDQTGFTFQGKK